MLWVMAPGGHAEGPLYSGAGAILVPSQGAEAGIEEETLEVR